MVVLTRWGLLVQQGAVAYGQSLAWRCKENTESICGLVLVRLLAITILWRKYLPHARAGCTRIRKVFRLEVRLCGESPAPGVARTLTYVERMEGAHRWNG